MPQATPIEPLSRQKQFPLTTVGALVANSSGRVLIVKTTKWKGTWGVPGGKVEWGESLETALKREFREEVGLELSHIRFGLLQEAVRDPQFLYEAHFIMVNYYAFSEKEAIAPNEEIVEWAWVSPEAALDYPLNTYTRVLVEDYIHREINDLNDNLGGNNHV
ncbi:NUDIX domain-containing protein [Phormidium sp. CCY1219]|uniref:NUDIX domain-containing protein n=1 Tax=Phormidium sp. CCY1219 TaxID=2886104 RepID=UPI002D1ECEB0|nr:NUDIX domain-containing protein [Phormidium sp. CCY1219]MEB3830856.1 NUDIX domain-containing protein [Phormidium sp. CCY1219]